MSKGDPIPTRFDPPEDDAIRSLEARTGLTRAEIVRRAVRLLAKRVAETGTAGFILDELAPPYSSPAIVAEAPAKYSGQKGKKRR